MIRDWRLGVAVVWLASGVARALPVVEQESRLQLTVAILPVEGSTTGAALGTVLLEIPPGDHAERAIDIPWPAGERGSHLRLRASGSPGEAGREHDAVLESWLLLPDTREVHSSRAFRLREGATRFLEVYGDARRRLILAVEAEQVTRPVLRTGPALGRPVRFRLEIERALGERFVPLETNRLDTFVGQAVTYSFTRGQDQELESLRIVLTPLRVEGESLDVEVRVAGTLPGGPGSIDRKERLVASRGATSSFIVASGQTPSGFRFLITPEF